MLPGVAIIIDHRIDLYNLNSLLFKIFRLWAITRSKGTCLTSGFLWIDFSADFQNLLWLLCHGAESKAHLGGWEEASRQQCPGYWAFCYFCHQFPLGKSSAGLLHTPLSTGQQRSSFAIVAARQRMTSSPKTPKRPWPVWLQKEP